MNIKKELFQIFQNKKGSYDLYETVIQFCYKLEFDARGQENSRFYSELNDLLNSINNAGHESRRAEQISFMNELQEIISKKYADYLP